MAIDKKIPSPQEITNSPISIPTNDIDRIKKLAGIKKKKK